MEKRKDFDQNRKLTAELQLELCRWNDDNVAFIKSDNCDGKLLWSVYAADGTKLAAAKSRDYAFWAARLNNLMPQSVH